MHKVVVMMLFILVLFLFPGCAPKEYIAAVDTGERLEAQHEYEQAYESYKKALIAKPGDTRVETKLNNLGEVIAADYIGSAVQAINSKKHKTALELLEKALKYDSANQKAMDYRQEVKNEYDKVREQYSLAEDFILRNMWFEAIKTLKEVSELYHDDPNLGNRIEDLQNAGYNYFIKKGLSARESGKYSKSLNYFESAHRLKTTDDSNQEILTAKKYMEAESLYTLAVQAAEEKNVLDAVELLIQSKKLVDDHAGTSRMMDTLIPEWSPLIFEKGKAAMEADQIEIAFNSLKKLTAFNPEYPEANQYLEELKSVYLQRLYQRMIEAQKTEDLSRIGELAHRIIDEDPDFLDSREVMVRAVDTAFNLFYQQGLNYMKAGNYGKAILCFRSSEEQLSRTQLTEGRIDEAWEQIRRVSAFRGVLLNFSQEIGDPSVSNYLASKIKEGLKNESEKNGFENVFIELGDADKDTLVTRSGISGHIDWGSLLTRGHNAVITGNVRFLKQDTSLNSEWKTRKRTVRKIVDNKEYTHLLMRQAELRSGAKSKEWRKKKGMSRGDIERELERLEQKLPTIPPKIEADVEEDVVTHMMAAHMQIDVEVLWPDGSHVWPMKHYDDQYQIEDSVVPPNLKSEDPKEGMGNPLTLPSEFDFKKQAVDYIVENRIVPELITDFRDYGIQFYERANKLSNLKEESELDETAFLDSIEEYFKFLACYEKKGAADRLREDVEKKLEGYISDLWLIRRK